MPAVASPSLWRSHPHSIREYLVILKPDVVFSASVNQASFTYPLASLTYDNVTVGAYTDIVVGQLARIRTAAGEIKGYTRVRKAPTSSLVYPAVIGQGDIDVDDNDVIDVLDDYRPQGKLPRIDASDPKHVTFYKDYDLAYSDQGAEPPPICNAGPFVARFVDPDTGLITVERDLTASFAVAPSATISSYSGDIVDGTVTSGSIASGTFTATFPAGKRWCQFTATDSNGKTHTKHVLIVACERTGDNAPIRIVSKNLHGTVGDGWTAGFTLLADDVSADVVVQGALVVYFVEEVYDYTAGSIGGYPDDEAVHFVGWITTVPTSIEPEISDVDITCAGPIGILRALPGFSQSVSIKASPTNWNQMASLTLFRYIWYLIYWHTTILDICDIEAPDWIADYPYARFDSDQANPYEIADAMAQAVTARLTCDRQGIFYLRKNPLYMTDEDRDDVPVIISLQASDWTKIRVEEQQRPPIFWLRASALVAQTGKPLPLLAISPGVLPGYGAIEDTFDKQLVASQTDLNIRAGHVYAERAALDNKIEIGILTGGMIADPAWREWVRLTLDADTNRRGITYSNVRTVILEVDVDTDVENAATTESWNIQRETSGVPAVTQIVPKDASLNPLLIPPLLDIPVFDPLTMTPIFNGNITLANSPATYAWTRNALGRLRKGSVNWELVYGAGTLYPGASQPRILDVRLDPWNPKNTAYITMHDGVLSGARIVQLDNLDSATPTITALLTSEELNTILGNSPSGFYMPYIHHIDLSINVDGYMGVNMVSYATGSYFLYRRNRADSWRNSNPGSPFTIAFGHHAPSPTSGRIYVGQPQPGGGVFESRIILSTDMGQTWSTDYQFTGLPIFAPDYVLLDMPYQDNNSDLLLYASSQRPAASNSMVRRNADGSYTDIAPLISGNYCAAQSMVSYTYDKNQLAAAVTDGGTRYLVNTLDAGGSWTEITSLPTGGVPGWIGGWPNDKQVLFAIAQGGSAALSVTENLLSGSPASVVWQNFTYDFYSVVDTSGGAFAIGLVPVWVN